VVKIDINQFKQELQHYTGSECVYRHSFSKGTYTEGVQFVASRLGAYWLMDLIFSLQWKREVLEQSFQTWKLQVGEGSTAVLKLEDGNGNAVLTHDIPFTDFPLPEFTFWLIDNVLLLPSEY
jgi:hypothetical protein